MQESKTCGKCKQNKPLDNFAKDKSAKDGLQSSCRECGNAYAKAYSKANPDYQKIWWKDNPEKSAKYQKAYRKANAEIIAAIQSKYYEANREKLLLRAKAYRESHPGKSAASSKEYRVMNRERIISYEKAYYQKNQKQRTEYSKSWARDNPQKVQRKNQIRRASKLTNGVFDVTAKELKQLYASKCAYCSAPSEHIDHVMPLSRGGTHSIGNLVGACASCNMSKHNKTIMEWRLWKMKL